MDADPQKWLSENLPIQFANEGIGKAIDSKDSEFLYLYGRAHMLTGNHRDAVEAFDAAIRNLRADPTAALPLGPETRLAEIAETLRQKRESGARASQEARMAEEKALRLLDELLGLNSATPLK